jgi:hypothetical protein
VSNDVFLLKYKIITNKLNILVYLSVQIWSALFLDDIDLFIENDMFSFGVRCYAIWEKKLCIKITFEIKNNKWLNWVFPIIYLFLKQAFWSFLYKKIWRLVFINIVWWNVSEIFYQLYIIHKWYHNLAMSVLDN